ncbi:hypothetical protein SDC9_211760 [bioreactor metagenome]|uniref:Uncharacterized protein n=1 Tax=bioreactor metagenome TaxID=1076179 RepID=A0A645JK77_9ZZZZ
MVTRDTDLVELLQVGRVNREKFNPLINGKPFVLCLQQYPVVKGEPADIAFKVPVLIIFHRSCFVTF